MEYCEIDDNVTELGSIGDEFGSSWSNYVIVPCQVLRQNNQTIGEYIKEYHPVEHCAHEYDCCGNAYCKGARVVGITMHGYMIEVSYVRNI